jgi:SpoIID/LytB domain protein
VEIQNTPLAIHPVCPRRPRAARTRRLTRLVLALAAAGILAGLAFAPAASAATGDFVISGRGNGQGQGMSQWGAWQGARLGKTYQEILAFYYEGTTLSTVASVVPTRQTITVRITTAVDTFSQVQLTAAGTSATLVDSTGATISSVAAGGSVTLLYSGGKVQVLGSAATYAYVDLKPDSDSGRVTVNPSPISGWSRARAYWGFIRILPNSADGQVYVHNTLPIEKYVAGVAEIISDWAIPTSTSYAPEAVKAQIVAARTYIAAHSSSVPYDDTRDINYVGYNYEASYPYVTQAAQQTAGVVITYGGRLIATHFSGHSGGYTSNSAWSDTGQVAYEPAKPDPWSLAAPPTNPAYGWTVAISPATLASSLAGSLNVGAITNVEVIARDTSDPTSHARTLRVTGSTGTATIAARTFRSLLGLKSTLILSVVKDGSLNRYEENDTHLVYAGAWTAGSATAASGGSHSYTDAAGSCTVSFNGTYLAWLATKGPGYGKAKLTLDGVDQGTVDLYSAAAVHGKVWETATLSSGTHTLKIEWTGIKNALGTDYNISVDAFDIAGTILQASASTRYQQNAAGLNYAGTWATFSASGASGGSYLRSSASGAKVTITFDGTYLAWIATKGTTLGNALVSLDGGTAVKISLAASAVAYQQNIWSTGMLSPGQHTVTISRDSNNIAGKYISVDAVDIAGTILQPSASTRYQQDATGLNYAGTWATFTTSGASGGSYLRASSSGAKVTITFDGTYLAWIATRGTTLGNALVSLDGGTAKKISLAASAVAYQQNVWNTGMLPPGQHTVTISRDSNNIAGKYISVDAVDVLGSLK